MRYTVVANGQDNYSSYLSFFGGTPLDTRIATYLSQYDQALSIVIDDQSRLFSIWGGTYPFQATIQLETLNSPIGTANVAERVRLAITRATGHIPSAVAVTSAGQPAPAPPAPGLVDETSDIVSNVAKGLNVTTQAATLIIAGLGLGALALIYYVATNPGGAAKTARSLR
jgi:hypothetical protein